ncbi:MAG: sensor histidine kinase [Candidatus Binatia bacterium]
MKRSDEGMTDRGEKEKRRMIAALARSLCLAGRREMAAALAHELSQPIGAILTYATSHSSLPGTEHSETMEIIAAQATRATDSLRTLKSAVRRGRAAWRPTDLNDLVSTLAGLFDAELEELGIALRLELAQPIPAVQADPERMAQVFLSVIQNAIEAMAEAPGPRELRIRSEVSPAREVEVRISDTGCGFPPGEAERLFERFFTTKPQSLGMGLAISRSIVEAHGGRLWGRADAEGGATFGVRMPIEEGESDDGR